jgi:hypothetical protein
MFEAALDSQSLILGDRRSVLALAFGSRSQRSPFAVKPLPTPA